MKVAIIGAGLAGLACGHELLRNGIIPDIFEENDYVGEVLDFPVINIRLFNSLVFNPFKYLSQNFQINITPHYKLTELVTVTPTRTHIIQGNLGTILRRGIDDDTLANQILKDINIQIQYNTPVNFEDIQDRYDHVVISTGNLIAAKKLNVFKPLFDAYVRIATLKGSFRTNAITIWLNTKYARHGFAYCVPNSESEAYLILIVTNANYDEFEYFWNLFIKDNIRDQIVNAKDLRHSVGVVEPVKVGNLYLAGFSGGFIDSFIGFGAMQSILSGAAAGYCISHNKDYPAYIKKIVDSNMKKYEFRKAFDRLDNKALDRTTRFVTLPGVRQLIYNNPLARITQGAPLARLYNKLSDYRYKHDHH